MSATKIRGNTQILADTITNTEINSAAAIATSKLADGAEFLKRNGTVALTGDLNANGVAKIIGLVDPTNPQDAATRAWVLAQLAGGVTPHAGTVRAATSAAGTLATSFENGDVIDGITLATGDRILIKNQAAAAENGIYTVNASGAPTRATDMDIWTEVPGFIVSVQVGTVNSDTLWLSTADLGGTLDTTAITFIQLPGPSDVIAGAGLTRTGQSIDVVAGDGSIVANANEIHVGVSGTGAIAGSGALSINTDDVTIEKNTNALRVKPGGIGETQLGAGVYQKVANIIIRETPSGSINGSNVTFTLANTPLAGSEQVFLNGILQEPGAGNDYTISTNTITYLTAPATGDRLRVSYLK
jgi:hypothetical protein